MLECRQAQQKKIKVSEISCKMIVQNTLWTCISFAWPKFIAVTITVIATITWGWIITIPVSVTSPSSTSNTAVASVPRAPITI